MRLPIAVLAASLVWLAAVPLHSIDAVAQEPTRAEPGAEVPAPAAARPEVPDFATGAAPDWVVAVPIGAPADGRTPFQLDLVDRQTRVTADGEERYVHVVRRIGESAGLETASQLRVDFDPSYQSLAVHRIEVVRGEQRIDKLDRKRIQVLRRETQLERQIYDGYLTASMVLDDIRTGDLIEFAYTLRGANPVFEGKFVEDVWVSMPFGPVVQFQYRLLAPEGRAIRYQAAPATTVTSSVSGGVRETLFQRNRIAQLQLDAYASGSSYIPEQIQLSEFADWAEVGQWANKLFDVAAVPSPEIAQQVDKIRAAAQDPATRVQMALDFVQTQIRYFGTEIGASSHRPAPPEQVVRQRFGDCKDKATLLRALLKELGIESVPALVSSQYRRQVGLLLPSPLAFDHVMTRVDLSDRPYWLDGTRSQQTGPIAQREAVELGAVLEARPGVAGPVVLPEGNERLRAAVEEVLRFEKVSKDPVLESRTTLYGVLAEFMRESIAARSLAEVEKQLVNDLVRLYPRIKASAPIGVKELPGQNAIELTMLYDMPEYWRFPEQRVLVGDFALWSLAQSLRFPDEATRKRAYQGSLPGIYRHTYTAEFPEDMFARDSSDRFDETNPFFEFHITTTGTVRRQQLAGELKLSREIVEPEEWASFKEKVAKVRPRLYRTMSINAVTLAQIEPLKRELALINESNSKGSKKPLTKIQADARVRQRVLTTQLESNRLPPALRAEALVARGIEYDALGRAAEGSADFEEALRLKPDNADAYVSAAINALILRKDALAIERASRALELGNSDAEPRRVRSYANYFSGNFAPARDELLEILKDRKEVERGYGAIWLYLAARRLGQNGVEAAKAYVPDSTGSSPARWPYPVLQMLLGQIDVDRAIKEAKTDGKDSPEKLCEVYYYMGERYLIDGDKRRARDYFQKSIDTGVVEFNEYNFSRRQIDALGKR